jgi:Type I restriction modification DNA specificity domain
LNKKIADIATIQTGVFAQTIKNGAGVYLQARHFDETGTLNTMLHADLEARYLTPRHLLSPGDVLFSAKGTRNFAAVFTEGNPPAVASTSFFVIRLLQAQVLPGYLAWYLNHANTQKKLKSSAMGTSIVSISKTVLEKLEIPIPAIDRQHLVLKIDGLQKTKKVLKQQIDLLHEQQVQQKIINAIK